MSIKKRVYTGVLYLDSAPEDWIQRAKNTHLDGFISPYHDKDVNPDGKPKKPHYHIMLMWENPTTYNNASNIFASIGALEHIEAVESTPGMARYLTHQDNPEKAQYEESDVICLGTANYEEVCAKITDKRNKIGEMISFINDHEITSFSRFVIYCYENENQWLNILTDRNTLFFKTFIDSMWQDCSKRNDYYTKDDVDEILRNYTENLDRKDPK